MFALYIFLLLSFAGLMCNAMDTIDLSLKKWHEEIPAQLLLHAHKHSNTSDYSAYTIKYWLCYKKESEELCNQGKFEELEQKIMTEKAVQVEHERTQADAKQHASCIIS